MSTLSGTKRKSPVGKGSPTGTTKGAASTATPGAKQLKQGSLFSFFKKKEPSSSQSQTQSQTQSTSTSKTPPTSAGVVSPSTTAATTTFRATSVTPSTNSSPLSQPDTVLTKSSTTAVAAASSSKPATTTNTLWKQVQVGDRLRIWWADDRKYYAANVLQIKTNAKTNKSNANANGSGTSFQVRYDDGESEWTDLSMEKFQFLKSNAKSKSHAQANDKDKATNQDDKKRRRIDDDDDEEEQEFEFSDDNGNDDSGDEGSVFEAKDDDADDKDDDMEDYEMDDDEDQWMVTDDEDDTHDKPASKKRAKSSNHSKKKKIRVTQHKPTTSTPPKSSSSSSSPAATKSSTSAVSSAIEYKTPLKQYANTVSPSTSSSRMTSKSNGAPPSTPPLPTVSQVTSSPTKTKALPYVKNAVNIQGAHVHNHLRFLQDPRDAQGRRRDDPNYDPRTLKVVYSDWEAHMGKMTNAVQQWWELKSQYFDSVLLFKTGKFYEMFHMDADIGVQVLQLSYMKGHVAHAGFPEISYGPMADKLVRAGYKVARVEQTETPDQLKERKAKTKGKKPSVVNREVCSIVSLGTRTFCALDDDAVVAELDQSTNTTGPLLTIAEVLIEGDAQDQEQQPVCEYGITIVDAVRATVTVGQFADDILRSRMNTLLTRIAPSEILLSPSASPVLVGLVKSYQRTTTSRFEIIQEEEHFPKSTALDPTHRKLLERKTPEVHPWNVQETLEELHRRSYYPRGSKNGDSIRRWPPVLQALVDGQANLGLASFGAALFYLQRHLIDQEILSMGIVKAYIPETSTNIPTSFAVQDTTDSLEEQLATIPPPISAEDQITHLSLDGTTLHNLEILTNSVDQKVKGSLWSKLNYCKTPHGARFLRAWLLRPLFRKHEIDRRADAVQELTAGAAAVALNEARQHVFAKVGDLDRLLSRIHTMSGNNNDNDEINFHPNDRAVLYESAIYNKRKVNDFSKALNGLRQACQIPELFADMPLNPDGLLFKLVRLQDQGGCFPNMAEELDWFFENFDCNQAAKGLFEPSRGMDEAYDEACDTIERIQADLEEYRKEMCQQLSPKHLATSSWKYVNTKPDSKDKYMIELPASVQVPDSFLVKGKRGSGAKQVNKYRTSVVARLVQELEQALEIQAVRKAKGMQLIFAKFDAKRSLWRAAAQATAMLDALGSLAKVAAKPGFCRPTILECPPDQQPVIDIVQGRHPCVEGSSIHTTEFIPNDLRLGGSANNNDDPSTDSARLLLLSGPNMGGKSTLLRQTCLIAILAQMGSYVPAESCSLTPVDCIYTRLGASDRILLGQSTFFVELAETAAALRGATRRSLVIMDELGRGTSTFDGTAIAGATVKHLIERSQCLSLFATHYHSLLDEWKNEPMVRLGHMQCLVEDSESDQSNDHSITFLYTLGPGTCPKSFGINVARLASLPTEVLDNAKRVSQEFEQEMADSHTMSDNVQSHKDQILAAIHSGDWEELQRLWTQLKA